MLPPCISSTPLPDDNFERIYQTPAEEFQLSEIMLKGEETFMSETQRSVEILICMSGRGIIEELKSGKPLLLSKGVSVMIPAAVPRYGISGNITLYKVGAIPGIFSRKKGLTTDMERTVL